MYNPCHQLHTKATLEHDSSALMYDPIICIRLWAAQNACQQAMRKNEYYPVNVLKVRFTNRQVNALHMCKPQASML